VTSVATRFQNTRSSSGEDVSGVRNNTHHHPTTGPRSVPLPVVIQRSSRSVDNIFTDEQRGSVAPVRPLAPPCVTVKGVAPVHSPAAGGSQQNNVGVTGVQLPYHTGRSIFYERVNTSMTSDQGEAVVST